MVCGVEPRCTVDGKLDVSDVVFLFELAKEDRSDTGIVRGKQPDMTVFIRLRIERSVQPVLFVLDSNHGFVECDLVRSAASRGLYIDLVHPVVDGRARAIDTILLKNRDCI